MIRGFFQLATRAVGPKIIHNAASLLMVPRFCFVRVSFHPTIQKIQSGIDSKSVKLLLADLKTLSEKDKD